MEQRKKLLAVATVVAVLVVGLLVWKGTGPKRLSGTYEADHSVNMMPDVMTFENDYCEIDEFSTYTYKYKGGKIYFFWGNAVWYSYKCTINGRKIVLENNNGDVVNYYKR